MLIIELCLFFYITNDQLIFFFLFLEIKTMVDVDRPDMQAVAF